MTELHSTTTSVLQAIRAFWAAKGYSPSIRDIMEATGISSTSVVRYHIDKLERAGAIKRTPEVARSYVLMEAILQAPCPVRDARGSADYARGASLLRHGDKREDRRPC